MALEIRLLVQSCTFRPTLHFSVSAKLHLRDNFMSLVTLVNPKSSFVDLWWSRRPVRVPTALVGGAVFVLARRRLEPAGSRSSESNGVEVTCQSRDFSREAVKALTSKHADSWTTYL